MKRLPAILINALCVFNVICVLNASSNLFAQDYEVSSVLGQYISDHEMFPRTDILVTEKYENGRVLQTLTFLQDGTDLSKRDLRNIVIHNRRLENVDFSYSDLTDADLQVNVFVNCNFSNATLANVNVEYTRFENCRFDNVVLEYGNRNFPLQDDPFPYKKLYSQQFNDPDGRLNSLSHKEGDFSDRKLSGKNVNLTREQFIRSINYRDKIFSNIEAAVVRNMTEHKLAYHDTKIFLDQAYSFLVISPEQADKYSYAGLDFTDALFIKCAFKNLDFSKANFENAKFIYSDVQCDFSGANFKNAQFVNSKVGGNFDEANLEDAKFESVGFDANIQISKQQVESSWNWKNNAMEQFNSKTLKLFESKLGIAVP